MRLVLLPGVGDKLRAMIAGWGVRPRDVARKLFDALERIAENPEVGERDAEGVFGNAHIYQFRIEFPPAVLNVSVAYDVLRFHEEVWILDVVPRFVKEEWRG